MPTACFACYPVKSLTMYRLALQSHAFHLTITAVVGMALYQGVTALARNEVTIDFWAGVLIVTAVAILILPILSIPFIFGGIAAKPLARDRMNFRAKVPLRPALPAAR